MNKAEAYIGNIQRFSTEDGPGIRTTVFLKGCQLKCQWCHNPELIAFEQQLICRQSKCILCCECIKVCPNDCILPTEKGITIDWDRCNHCMKCTKTCYAQALTGVAKKRSVQDVMDVVIRDKDFYDETDGGITISGGEPLSQFDFTLELVQACKTENVSVCIDTSGIGRFEHLLSLGTNENLQYFLYDIKNICDDRHREFTGIGNAGIIKNLRMLASEPKLINKIWVRMPLINNVNDDEEIINDTFSLLKECGIKKVTLLPYHKLGISKWENIGEESHVFEAPSEEKVYEIYSLFSRAGIDVSVLGKDYQNYNE